jgi:hypothetical protein
MAETVGPGLPSWRLSMVVLPKIGGGSSAPYDQADMGHFYCTDKLDNT